MTHPHTEYFFGGGRPLLNLGAWDTANLMLQETVERIYTKDVYADIQRGIYIVRGENVLLLGEIVRRSVESLILNIEF